jgi:hypothetical protein
MKAYKHRGYTLRATDTTTDKKVYRGEFVHHTELRRTYEILDASGDIVKSATAIPLLTSVRECKDFINDDLGASS